MNSFGSFTPLHTNITSTATTPGSYGNSFSTPNITSSASLSGSRYGSTLSGGNNPMVMGTSSNLGGYGSSLGGPASVPGGMMGATNSITTGGFGVSIGLASPCVKQVNGVNTSVGGNIGGASPVVVTTGGFGVAIGLAQPCIRNSTTTTTNSNNSMISTPSSNPLATLNVSPTSTSWNNSSTTSNTSVSQPNNPNTNDFLVPVEQPNGTITSLEFTTRTNSNMFLAGSKDGYVHVFDIRSLSRTPTSSNSNVTKLGKLQHPNGSTSACWSADGTKIFSAGVDGKAFAYDVQSMAPLGQIAQHDKEITKVQYMNNYNLLMSGSRDQSIKSWDGRTQAATFQLRLTGEVVTFDVNDNILAVGTTLSDRKPIVAVYDLRDTSKPLKTITDVFKEELKDVAILKDKDGIIVGSSDSRAVIRYFDDKKSKKNFSFRCNNNKRISDGKSTIYAVNSVLSHPVSGNVCTAGTDGTYNIWDYKVRGKVFKSTGWRDSDLRNITSTAFNTGGDIIAYGLSYDGVLDSRGGIAQHGNWIYIRKLIRSEYFKTK